MASKKGKGTGNFLWGEDDLSANPRTSGTNLSGARFSTRDYAVDQSVNLMAMGETPSAGGSSGSGLPSSVAGLFRASTGTEAPRFDEYGDAAPSGESEEYISDKQRRMTPMAASVRNFVASKSFFAFVLAMLGFVLLGGGIYLGVNKEKAASHEKGLKQILIEKGVTPAEVFAQTDPNPQKMALKWIMHEDPAKLTASDKGVIDRYILAVFYYGSNDSTDGWTKNDNWMTGKGTCSWAGVQCVPIEVTPSRENNFQKTLQSYDANEHITGFILSSNNIEGTIPDEFGHFPELMIMDLSDNAISGGVPSGLGKLPKIRDIYLRKNTLFGSFPSELTKLATLHQLHLGENQLDGTISGDISEMKNLRSLSLTSNAFTGPFPYIQPLAYLINLHLDDNRFSSTIPDWLYSKSEMQDLRLSTNQFSGTISSSILQMRNLEILHLDHNQFDGTFPNMFDSAPRITELKLDRNKFSGPIPDKVWHLQGVKILALDNNKFNGTIGQSIGTLVDVATISLHLNELTGSIPTEIGYLNDVANLTLNSNKLVGTIPTELGGCFRLSVLDLDQNKLTGTVPSELGKLDRLTEVRLEMNDITGTMPSQLCTLTKTEKLTHLSADCKNQITCTCCNQCL